MSQETTEVQVIENLNLDDRVRYLTVKALNKSSAISRKNVIKEAAKLLGISERTVYRHIEHYKIKCHFS